MKIVNIDEEIFISSERFKELSPLIMILEVTKNKASASLQQINFWKNHRGGGLQIVPLPLFRVKYVVTVALNHESIGTHPERIALIRPFVDQCDWKDINPPTGAKNWKILKQTTKQSLSIFIFYRTIVTDQKRQDKHIFQNTVQKVNTK